MGELHRAAAQSVRPHGGPYALHRAQHAHAASRGAAGDVVYLGNTVAGKPEWQHVIICVGKNGGDWVYDSHTRAYLQQPIDVWYPEHFSLISYCHIADVVSYAQGE